MPRTPLAPTRRWPFSAAAAALLAATAVAVAATFSAHRRGPLMGLQPDGSFLVSSGQRVEPGALAFNGRPSDLALHPNGNMLVVLNQHEVFLTTPRGVLARSHASLGDADAGFHGLIWTGDHTGADWRAGSICCVASTDQGYLEEFLCDDNRLQPVGRIVVTAEGDKRNAWPGGMCLTRDRRTLFVAAAGLDAVVEVDMTTHKRVREYAAETLPYDVRLSVDERTLIVSNWGGRKPRPGDLTAKSDTEDIVVDRRGAPASGTVLLIDRATGAATELAVGIHPNAVAVAGNRAYVANGMSDTVSEIDVAGRLVRRTLSLAWHGIKALGAMPNAIAVRGAMLYVCNGGDNAVCEIDLATGAIRGFRPAGYFPSAIQLSADGKTAFVLNSKGNGSVANTLVGNPGSPHDFQGTVSIVDLSTDIRHDTEIVARDNHWSTAVDRPRLAVYNGAIKHVLYIIKENQTYDSIFGDMPQGNGDPKLCVIGERGMPNHRALGRAFTLFDNAYVSGTNSADGHAWCTQSLANDYMEHFYVGYRTYPDDGDCAMSISNGGCLWDTAAAKHKSIRVYGEFCDDDLAQYLPYKPRDWFEAWDDYKRGGRKFTYVAKTWVAGLKPYLCPRVHYWPLIQSDQSRADEFLKEYEAYSRADRVPDLMILCLPCDHSEGLNPDYPTTRAMQADNDLALGRVVEGVSHSPQWKDTCIFVIEDDGQALPDHVDGHRVPFFAVSPYTRRKAVDSSFYTTTNMLRSIEMMLGIDPMNRFDGLSQPITACFVDRPDPTPYTHVPNSIPLDERNPPLPKMTTAQRGWYRRTRSLNWSHIDGPDPYWLSRIEWYTLTDGRAPFPVTPGQPTRPQLASIAQAPR